jgi:hypothetical protein
MMEYYDIDVRQGEEAEETKPADDEKDLAFGSGYLAGMDYLFMH